MYSSYVLGTRKGSRVYAMHVGEKSLNAVRNKVPMIFCTLFIVSSYNNLQVKLRPEWDTRSVQSSFSSQREWFTHKQNSV